MDKFVIHGGKCLSGEVLISGAKNSTLALMPATLLTSGKSILKNTPSLNDVYTMIKLLNGLGAEIRFENETLIVSTDHISNQTAPYEVVKKMRASVYVLGPLLARYGYAKVSLPGGCAWGPRPINLHVESLIKMGAEIELNEGYIIAKSKKLHGAKINFDISSVGATGNVLMAASLAKGTTVINNAAIEPEITQLTQFLKSMGARIEGIGTNKLTIEGVHDLSSSEIVTLPDRIETGTLLIAGAITKSKITLRKTSAALLEAVLLKLEDCGCNIKVEDESITIDATNSNLKSTDITTSVYPGFPTDMQAQWTALMSVADGVSSVSDSIYYDRFKHVPELIRLGANITVNENTSTIQGVKVFRGAKVMSTDLRASACLVLAGLAAQGKTEVLRVYHLDRGYQRIEEKLKLLGADIKRVKGKEF